MKRHVLMAVLLTAAVGLWADSTMSVQVERAPVKGAPNAWGAVVDWLAYGDQVDIAEERAGWYKITAANGVEGWMQESSLTRKRVVLSSSGSVSGGASTEEVALAGKGFNADVEQEYKSGTQLDFTWVEAMVEWEIPTDELADFLDEGDLGEALR